MSSSKTSVFVIGTSISIGYGPYLEAFLGDQFSYSRKSDDEPNIPTHLNGENAGDSNKILGYLQARLDIGHFTPDILLIHCGLHDLRRNLDTNAFQVDPDQYKQNVKAIVELAKAHKRFIVWVRATPVDDERHNSHVHDFKRFDADVCHYNEIVDAIMTENNIPLIDLYGFIRAIKQEVYVDHVHFTDDVARLQGAFIAGFLQSIALTNQVH